MRPHLDAITRQDDLLQNESWNLESEIDAKLKELKLKSPGIGGGFKGEPVQDIPAVVEAQDLPNEKVEMTSEKLEEINMVEVEDMTSEDYYYDPLGHFAAHEEALKDESRMLIWQQVSFKTTWNSSLFGIAIIFYSI